MKDRDDKGRQMRGIKHHLTHLTEDQIKLIRLDMRTAKEIAAEYGVHFETINAIRTGKTWKHVDGEYMRRRLTESQVIAIRGDTRPRKIIADEYGVSVATIKAIRSRRNWKHI
jgi:uncharacterized protein YjcR